LNIFPDLEGNNFCSVPPVMDELFKKIRGYYPKNYFKKDKTFGYKPPSK
jgi:hypothetical protein